jgi:hypothetical protein
MAPFENVKLFLPYSVAFNAAEVDTIEKEVTVHAEYLTGPFRTHHWQAEKCDWRCPSG